MIAVGALNEFLSEAIEDNPVDIFSPGLFQTDRTGKMEEDSSRSLVGRQRAHRIGKQLRSRPRQRPSSTHPRWAWPEQKPTPIQK
jgi:hypothetical protein